MGLILKNRLLRRYNHKLKPDNFGEYIKLSELRTYLFNEYGIQIEIDPKMCPLLIDIARNDSSYLCTDPAMTSFDSDAKAYADRHKGEW